MVQDAYGWRINVDDTYSILQASWKDVHLPSDVLPIHSMACGSPHCACCSNNIHNAPFVSKNLKDLQLGQWQVATSPIHAWTYTFTLRTYK